MVELDTCCFIFQFELMLFEGIWLPKKTQYFWYQVDYQLGVFISRSSVNIFPVNKLWVLPIIQVGIDLLTSLNCACRFYAMALQMAYSVCPAQLHSLFSWCIFCLVLFSAGIYSNYSHCVHEGKLQKWNLEIMEILVCPCML